MFINLLLPSTANTRLFSLVLPLTLISFSNGQKVEEERMSEAECNEAGFNPETLKCSACQMLDKFNLEEILTDCMRCCQDEVKFEDQQERFPYAEIEVCECNLHRFPQIAAFVRGDMKNQWGSQLKVRQVRGVLPTIVLKDADGLTKRTMSIEKWDTDTVTEFLNNVLQRHDEL